MPATHTAMFSTLGIYFNDAFHVFLSVREEDCYDFVIFAGL